MRFHSQNLTDGRLPTWRHGRAWLGPWGFEWGVFRWYSWFSARVYKGGYEGDRVGFHVAVPWFFLFVYRSCGRSFAAREAGAYWFGGSLVLLPWVGDAEDRAYGRAPRRGPISLDVRRWICGAPRVERSEGEPVAVLVPMPEGCYRATVTREETTRVYRLGIARRETWFWLRVDRPGGIPFAGKGENGWDCGDDGLCGIGGETPEEAIGRAVASALKTRGRYGCASHLRGAAPVMAPADASPGGEVTPC